MCEKEEIVYKEKEFLDSAHGTYKYPDAVTGKKNVEVKCYPSEMLFAPDGKLYRCHHFLYAEKEHTWHPGGVLACKDFGLCNPCDVKLKTNRLQQDGHCSVRIEHV
jgi:hypothetical protein